MNMKTYYCANVNFKYSSTSLAARRSFYCLFRRRHSVFIWYSSYIGCCQYFSWTVLEGAPFKYNSGCSRANGKGRLWIFTTILLVFVKVYVTYASICSIFHLICTLTYKFIIAGWVKKNFFHHVFDLISLGEIFCYSLLQQIHKSQFMVYDNS